MIEPRVKVTFGVELLTSAPIQRKQPNCCHGSSIAAKSAFSPNPTGSRAGPVQLYVRMASVEYRDIVLESPLFCIAGAKLYRRVGGTLGQSILWEQQHMLKFLGVRDPVAYRKQQHKRGYLDRLCADWTLPDGSWVAGDARLGKTIVLATSLITPWLLSQISPRGGTARESTREQARVLLLSFSAMFLRGLQHMPPATRIRVRLPCGAFAGELPLSSADSVPDDRSFVSFAPELGGVWARLQEGLQGKWHLPDMSSASAIDWCVFAHAYKTFTGSHDAVVLGMMSSLAREANNAIATCIELWLLQIYVPSVTGLERVQILLGKSGRQRVRMDSYTKAGALWKCKQSHGSTSTFLAAALDDPKLDCAINRAVANIYLGKVSSVFADTRRLMWTWDPGSYSGHEYNLGLAYSVDIRKAATVPPKVDLPKRSSR